MCEKRSIQNIDKIRSTSFHIIWEIGNRLKMLVFFHIFSYFSLFFLHIGGHISAAEWLLTHNSSTHGKKVKGAEYRVISGDEKIICSLKSIVLHSEGDVNL